MTADHRLEIALTCDYCGHESRLTVAAVSLPYSDIRCPLCGNGIGELGELPTKTAEADEMEQAR